MRNVCITAIVELRHRNTGASVGLSSLQTERLFRGKVMALAITKFVSQYSTVVLTVVRVMIAKYRKSGIWGYRSSLTPEPVELK